MEFKWEKIDDYHVRAKVFGGWLVKSFESVHHWVNGQFHWGRDWRVAMAFVPDPNHEWNIDYASE